MDTIAGQLQWGIERINTCDMPKFRKFLVGAKKEHDKEQGVGEAAEEQEGGEQKQQAPTYLWDYPMAFKRAFLRARGQKSFTNLDQYGLDERMREYGKADFFRYMLEANLNTTKDAEDACRAAAATRATVNEFLQHQQQVDEIFDAQEVAAAQEVGGSSSYDGGDLGVCSEVQRD
ncbi:hypothetical protein B484DRAFT_456589 [Ochromonadaceae sp. CCMP2298]|nr:hypothetical protein B484DRAFT_456589 [Ochromonadaceae sp. CCMP2298]